MSGSRWHRLGLATAGLLLMAACQAEQLVTPQPPAAPPAGLGAVAIRVEVNLPENTVRVLSFPDQPGPGPGIEAALLGTNEVTATTSNLTRSTPGQFTLNKVRVRFDVALTNRLTSASLVPATFPGGAAGTAGLLLFPFQVTQVTGGTVGQVDPSVDWSGDGSPLSGAPRNFFNDTGCPTTGPRSDCFRWEQFPAPLGPGETTRAQGVGFDVKPTVQSFQVLLILAADISSDLPAVARVVVTPPSYVMNNGFPANFSAVAYDVANNPLTWAKLTWTTADITALEFQLGGSLVGAITGTSQVVHGRKVGPTSFTVSSGGVSVVVPLDILVNTVALVQLFTPDSSITVGDQIQGDVRVKDHSGNIIPGFQPTWSTTDPNVIMVDQNGLITATGPGTADVVATAGLQSGRVTITVSPKPTGDMAGTVLDLDGQPVAGATISAFGGGGNSAATTTDGAGGYSLSLLAPGLYLVSAQKPGSCTSLGTALPTVVAGQTTMVPFQLDCPAQVSGTVTAAPGPLPSGVLVSLIANVGGSTTTTPVQPDGSYLISGIPTGGYFLSLAALPANCGSIGDQSISIVQQAHLVQNFSVNCSPVTGWTTKAAMPTPRGGLAGGVISGVLYAVGGLDASNAPLGTVEAYDPTTDSWSTKAAMPTPRFFLSGGVINGILYAVGGRTNAARVGTVEAYDPTTDSWSTKAPMPTPREGLTVGVINGILYAVGGVDALPSTVGTVEAYDPTTNLWSTKAALPTPRQNLAAGVINGVLYAVGGFDASIRQVGTVEAYDPTTDSWSTKAALPTPRSSLAGGVVNGILYAVGGFVSTGQVGSTGNIGTVEAYDPTTDSWSTKAVMPTQRSALAGGVISGILYAVGGADATASTVGTVEAYQP